MKKNFLKRIIAIALGATLLIPCTVAVSAESITSTVVTPSTPSYESEYTQYYSSTKLSNPTNLDEAVKNQVIEDYIKKLNTDGHTCTSDKASVDYYGTLQDGSLLVHTDYEGFVYPAVMTYVPLGKYIYVYAGGQEVEIYKNHNFYSIIDLYNSGELTEDDLDDIAVYLNLESLKTKEDLITLIRDIASSGGTPIGEDFTYALENANTILKNENANFKQYTTAYYKLEKSVENRDWEVYDKSEIRACYKYCIRILEDYPEYFDDETLAQLSVIENEIMMDILYPLSQEDIDSNTESYTKQIGEVIQTIANPDIPAIEEVMKIRELAEQYLDTQSDAGFSENILGTMPIFVDFNGYRIYLASFNVALPMPLTERINGYIYEDVNYYLPSDFGYLAINPETGDVIELEEALENKVIDENELFAYASEHQLGFTMYRLGDADNDKELTIKDATLVQKASLGIEEIVNTENDSDTVYDYDNDGRVCIVDVTKIQKAIVAVQ